MLTGEESMQHNKESMQTTDNFIRNRSRSLNTIYKCSFEEIGNPEGLVTIPLDRRKSPEKKTYKWKDK